MKRLIIAIAALGLIAAACGGSGDNTAGTSRAVHNQSDIGFLQGMIPHHEQAVIMSGYASTRAASPQVKDLAKRIEGAQAPEIKQMTGLLKDWGVKEEAAGHSGMGGMGGMGGHPGMLTDDDLGRLKAAKGQEFDRLFLQGMIGHHRGAITSSEEQLAKGESPEAKALADEIINAQRAEIAEMEKLLVSAQ
ncbi:MAG: DUF305 domain-containing protein [Actinobacteria bacterium]|nr:DUF305 domain-containing protein [Actinomycetota bacterium]